MTAKNKVVHYLYFTTYLGMMIIVSGSTRQKSSILLTRLSRQISTSKKSTKASQFEVSQYLTCFINVMLKCHVRIENALRQLRQTEFRIGLVRQQQQQQQHNNNNNHLNLNFV